MPSAIITATWRVRKVCGRNELARMHTAHCAVKRSASVCRIFRAPAGRQLAPRCDDRDRAVVAQSGRVKCRLAFFADWHFPTVGSATGTAPPTDPKRIHQTFTQGADKKGGALPTRPPPPRAPPPSPPRRTLGPQAWARRVPPRRRRAACLSTPRRAPTRAREWPRAGARTGGRRLRGLGLGLGLGLGWGLGLGLGLG